MDSLNTVSTKDILNVIEERFPEYDEIEWYGLKIKIRNTLPFDDVMKFVDVVCNGCFSQEDGEYIPEVKDFLIKTGIIKLYTDIEFSGDYDEQYKAVYGSTIIMEILDSIDRAQFGEILKSIDKKIESKARINELQFNKKIDNAISEIEGIISQVGNTFSDISKEDIDKLIGAVTSEDFSADAIVNAYIDRTTHEKTEKIEEDKVIDIKDYKEDEV